jgi:hypothetical protein
MKISVISKEVHAKPLYAWLVSNGFDVAMLGDNPTAIPSSTEVLVCRHRSCSHQASHLAQSWAKKTGRPMIMENGLKTISRKLNDLVTPGNEAEPKSEEGSFLLDIKKLDEVLEHAPGKTMSWLARALSTRVDVLIPALMDAKRLSEVSATLALPPAANDDEEEVPSAPTLEELEQYAAIILEDRAEDPFEVQLNVLRHMADGGVDDEVLRSLLNAQQAAQEDSEEDPEEVEVEPEAVAIEEPADTGKHAPLEAIEPLPPEESPMGGFTEVSDAMPATLMEAFEALRQEVVALRTELRELKTPRASVTLDDLIAVGAHITITPKDNV